jgi:hypothetical protein
VGPRSNLPLSLELDPALPGLSAALDPGAASVRFQELLAASRGGASVATCERVETKYAPGASCVVAYRLRPHPGDAARQTIGVVEVDRSGIDYRLFHDDPGIPALASAVDTELMGERFRDLGESEVQACRVTPVRYKPGRSCVLRYGVRSNSREQTFFGKLVRHGGAQLSSTLRALHAASLASRRMPGVIPPLAYWPDLQLIVQPPGGTPLSLADEEAASIRDAGKALAWLHESSTPGPRRALEDDLAELRGYRPLLSLLAPELLSVFDAAASAISRVGGGGEPPPVASHGALRVDQFLMDDGHLALIDFDAFCWSNPARDPGNLLAYLDWKAIRRPDLGALVDRARSAFLDGYTSVREFPGERWLGVYRATSMLKIAGRRFRSLAFEEWPLVPHLIATALDMNRRPDNAN